MQLTGSEQLHQIERRDHILDTKSDIPAFAVRKKLDKLLLLLKCWNKRINSESVSNAQKLNFLKVAQIWSGT